MDRLTEERTTERGHASNIRSVSASRLAWIGIPAILVVGGIHLLEAPEYLEEATYLGLLFFVNFGGAVAAAIGIYLNRGWGWGLGAAVAGGAFAGYVISRTIGLPGLPVEEWLEPLGILSLLVEALFVGLCLAVFFRLTKEARMV